MNRIADLLNRTSWTTPDQMLLLHAALDQRPMAISAWKEWTAEVKFEDIDYGSQRLLPLLYQNLHSYQIESTSLMALYKGIYKRFWLSNQFLFSRVSPVIRELYQAGIDMLFMKGAGLVLGLGLDTALRPMDDIDLLVREQDAQRSIEIIKRMGWLPKNPEFNQYKPLAHAIMYHDGRGHYIDLHWRSLINANFRSLEEEIWGKATKGYFDNIPIHIMGFTDQLIHTIVHGMHWNRNPSIRWIADAIILLNQTENSIDWDYLTEGSRKLHVTQFMNRGLEYLKDEFAITVPEQVLESLRQFPISRSEHWLYLVNTQKPLPVIGEFIKKIFRYLTFHQGEYKFPGFLRYIQDGWNLDHLRQIPWNGISRMWRKVKIDLFGYDPLKS